MLSSLPETERSPSDHPPTDRPPTDRKWPLPSAPWVMRMRWSDLLFAHWPLDPEVVRPLLPAGLELDVRDGQAWIGVVPFLMSRTAPRWCPPVPGVSRFLELNVRTYVTRDGKPGVWFFSLDAESWLGVRGARAAFHLPYMDADMTMTLDGDTHDYTSRRTHRGEPPANFDATYAPAGDMFFAQPGSLEHWLTARYCLYSAARDGTIYRGEIDHPPWQLSKATYRERTNTMGEPYHFEFSGDPHLLYAQPVDVHAWLIKRC